MNEFQAEPVRDYDSLVQAFVAAKSRLNISNECLEAISGPTRGHISKILAVSREKRIGWFVFAILCEALAIEFVPRVNIEAAKRMAGRWEGRNASQVRVRPNSISKEAIRRATPFVMSELGRKGALAANRRRKAQRNAAA